MNWDPLAFERWEQVVVVALLLLFFAYQTSEVRRSRIAAERAQHGNHKLSKGASRILTLQEQQQQHIELVKQTLTTSNSGSHILDKINQMQEQLVDIGQKLAAHCEWSEQYKKDMGEAVAKNTRRLDKLDRGSRRKAFGLSRK